MKARTEIPAEVDGVMDLRASLQAMLVVLGFGALGTGLAFTAVIFELF
jgi:hypothetical protein